MMVCFVDIINIILVSIFMKNSCSTSRNLIKNNQIISILKNWGLNWD